MSTAFSVTAMIGAEHPLLGEDAPPVPQQTNQLWNWHVQNTDIIDGHGRFHAPYSGANSMQDRQEIQQTVSLDIMAGVRTWQGGEAHVDGLLWQGFGFSRTTGIDAFPNAEAFRIGTKEPNVNFSRAFFRQVIGLGGEQETVTEDDFHLATVHDISRITLTAGRFSAKDIFDNNAYANDGRSQFMSWGLTANQAWDYPADSLGFETGLAVELNQPVWTARYGFFQMPKVSNGVAQDTHYLDAWGMVAELERRFQLGNHPGTVRFLGYLNRAHMGSYEQVVDDPSLGGDITATRQYRLKYGFGFNAEQELATGIGAFLRLGWSDGRNEAWCFSDVDYAASGGFSVDGRFWERTGDTVGLGAVFSGISKVHQRFFQAGGTGVLAGDGQLDYAAESVMELYYDVLVHAGVHLAVDYQLAANPAFNQSRGPISIFSARLHWHF